METDLATLLDHIKNNCNATAADNTEARLSWSLQLSWDTISSDNPLIEKAVKSKKFQDYFDSWYAQWPDKNLDGQVACFEAALISFIGYICKYFIEKLSNNEVRATGFTCNENDEKELFDYIMCEAVPCAKRP
ncbi:MAG: hypothetical protein GY868_14985 [Deltaproteobacteria bacterium]|nr:hypothetical protein [Deltaproteobacteria bacterium]